MQCTCGYNFALNASDLDTRPYKGFAVIPDESHEKVMHIEAECLQSVGQEAKLEKVAQASQHVGCLHICPECDRYLLLLPPHDDDTGPITLTRET
jgi:hypothetical protein